MNNLAMGISGDVSHIIQTALAPIFLLSGIASLLNVFSTRLARVSDHFSHLSELLEASTDDEQKAVGLYSHLRRLIRRRLALDAAVVCAGLAGGLHLRRGVHFVPRNAAGRDGQLNPDLGLWTGSRLHHCVAVGIHRRYGVGLAWRATGRSNAADEMILRERGSGAE